MCETMLPEFMLRLSNAGNKYQMRSNVAVSGNMLSAMWLLAVRDGYLAVRSDYWMAVRSKVTLVNLAYCIRPLRFKSLYRVCRWYNIDL